MVSALDDPLLQKYIFLRNDTTCRRRIDSWLSLFLDAQLAGEADGEQSSQADSDVLEKILNYTKYMKVYKLFESTSAYLSGTGSSRFRHHILPKVP